jgi:hypothetical protein
LPPVVALISLWLYSSAVGLLRMDCGGYEVGFFVSQAARSDPVQALFHKEPEGHPLAQSRQTVYEPCKACTQVAAK